MVIVAKITSINVLKSVVKSFECVEENSQEKSDKITKFEICATESKWYLQISVTLLCIKGFVEISTTKKK